MLSGHLTGASVVELISLVEGLGETEELVAGGSVVLFISEPGSITKKQVIYVNS
jgi:hypothetical protein